jgi:hypothetical protein
MIYTVGMEGRPSRYISPDIGDVLVVVLPNGSRRCCRYVSGNLDMCYKCCPMARMDVLSPDKCSKRGICRFAAFTCYSKQLGYHWEEIPIEAIMEEII